MKDSHEHVEAFGKVVKREPLLSDDRLWYRNNQDDFEQLEGHVVRDFYEAKITSGELVVRKDPLKFIGGFVPSESKRIDIGTDRQVVHSYVCVFCGGISYYMDRFCPSCGARIIE